MLDHYELHRLTVDLGHRDARGSVDHIPMDRLSMRLELAR